MLWKENQTRGGNVAEDDNGNEVKTTVAHMYLL